MRISIVILTIVSLVKMGVGQDTVEVYTYGGEKDDFCSRVLETEDGFLLFGTTSSFGNGPTDIYIVRVDKDYQFIESRVFGGFDIERFGDVVEYDDSYYFCGTTNTDAPDRYTGFIWQIGKNLDSLNRIILDFGERTVPEKLLVHEGELFVTGEVLESENETFVAVYNDHLNLVYKRVISQLIVGQIKSWVSVTDSTNDSILVTYTNYLEDDSVSFVSYYDDNWNELKNWEVPDSIGFPRHIMLLADSSVFVTGDKIDKEINGPIPYASFAKLTPKLDSVIWLKRFHFVNSESRVAGVKSLESNDTIYLIANTSFQFSAEKKSFFYRTYTPDGQLVFGNNNYFGFAENDLAFDAILLNDNKLLVAGMSEGMESGNFDFMIATDFTDQSNFEYSLNQFVDNRFQTLSNEEIVTKHSKCAYFDANLKLVVNHCDENIAVFNSVGQIVFFASEKSIHDVEGLESGLYIISTTQSSEKFVKTK